MVSAPLVSTAERQPTQAMAWSKVEIRVQGLGKGQFVSVGVDVISIQGCHGGCQSPLCKHITHNEESFAAK